MSFGHSGRVTRVLSCLAVLLPLALDASGELTPQLVSGPALANVIEDCLKLAPSSGHLIVASPWLDFSPSAVGDDDINYIVAWFADRVPRNDGRVGDLTLSSTYRNIIEYHEAALPATEASVTRRASLARSLLLYQRSWLARLFLGAATPKPSKQLESYRSYSRRYGALFYAYQLATSDADRTHFAAEMREVEQDWMLFGFKRQVENAFEALDLEARSDPQAHWAVASQRFSEAPQATARGTQFLPAVAAPPYQAWTADTGWTHCTAAGGTISLDIKTVAISRAWFDADLVFSNQWRWIGGSPYEVGTVSDGTGGLSQKPGWVPLLPSQIILIRNAAVELSPGVQLKTSAPRIGGWIALQTPKSPDPESGLHWPSDLVDPHVERAISVGFAAMTAITWRPGRGQDRPLWPNAAIDIEWPKNRIGLVIGSGFGPRFRAMGLVVGVSTPISTRIPSFLFGGIRIPLASAREGPRGVLGLGVRFGAATH